MAVLRSVGRMAAGARHLSALETAGLHERLRPVEAARAAVGPEFALRIVGRYWLADEERQRVILVAIARFESEEDVVFVSVAVAAGVEHLARRRTLRRENPQQFPQLAVLRAVVE